MTAYNREEAQRVLKEIREIQDSGMTCAEQMESIRILMEEFYYGDDSDLDDDIDASFGSDMQD